MHVYAFFMGKLYTYMRSHHTVGTSLSAQPACLPACLRSWYAATLPRFHQTKKSSHMLLYCYGAFIHVVVPSSLCFQRE